MKNHIGLRSACRSLQVENRIDGVASTLGLQREILNLLIEGFCVDQANRAIA